MNNVKENVDTNGKTGTDEKSTHVNLNYDGRKRPARRGFIEKAEQVPYTDLHKDEQLCDGAHF